MKIIAIIGQPGSGKTTLMRRFLFMTKKKPFKFNTIEGYVVGNGIVLGRYSEGGEYDGTDRLSMDVMKHWDTFLKATSKAGYDYIMFEGDRFACEKTLSMAESIFCVESTKSEERNKNRSKPVSDKFYTSRLTKVKNMKSRYKEIVVLQNDTEEQLFSNHKILCEATKN